MNQIAQELYSRLSEAMPGAKVYWEKEPSESSLNGAVVSSEYKNRKFTMQFIRGDKKTTVEDLDDEFIDQVVDDFTDFFSRTIYPKEKFTRII